VLLTETGDMTGAVGVEFIGGDFLIGLIGTLSLQLAAIYFLLFFIKNMNVFFCKTERNFLHKIPK
jgi:hypothetical protein